MIITCVERYQIEKCDNGVIVKMRQGRQALVLAAISLVILLLSWLFGPYGPQVSMRFAPPAIFYGIWCGFFSLVAILGIVGTLYREIFTITDREIVAATILGLWAKRRHFAKGPSLAIRIEILGYGTSTGRAVFPYRLHLLDAEGKCPGLMFELQLPTSVDRFLAALRPALNLEVEDPRVQQQTFEEIGRCA